MKRIISTLLSLLIVTSLFTLQVSAVSYETENNDDYDVADILASTGTVSGTIGNNGDEDYYKIITPANGKLSVEFTHKYVNNSDGWNITVYRYFDGEYTELETRKIRLNDNEKITLPFIGAVKNETYYIKISNYWSNAVGKPYSVKTVFTASEYYEKVTNNDYDTATKTNLNKAYTGILNYNDDNDYYKVIAPSNGKLSVEFSHKYVDNRDGWTVAVYRYHNGKYSEIECQTIRLNDNEKITLPFVGVAKSGIYYIKVSHYWSSAIGQPYSVKSVFKASEYCEKESNYDYYTATKITVGKTYAGTLNNYVDEDYYKVIAPAKGKMFVEFTHKYENKGDGWDIAVYRYYKGEYIELKSQVVRLRDNNKMTLPYVSVAKSGTYYIKISPYWKSAAGKSYSVKTSFKWSAVSGLKAKADKKSVKLSWKKKSGAKKYEIQQKKSGKYENIKSTKSNKYTVKKLKRHKKYYFRIRYYKYEGKKKYYSEWKTIKVNSK